MKLKRAFAATSVLATCLATALGVAAPADAATHKNGVLETGEFGLYYLQNQSGYVFDLYVSDDNFAGDVFPGTSISANDNTESYRNRDSYWWHVFTNASYTGSHGCLSAGYVGNASATYKNTISSAYWSSASC
ncbi:hypothetical protein Ga0074812_105158 [Parafrankia irregularis]|uniref:Peptidase inhibitor family I36 n=1 Tax=Parafrankia irregularis TaxID=795642 RepID=A0A0S4QJ30_9ACTN|nr:MULTISPECIES: peptidase inhibitor family I36 protein [Parafrankia]MBE3205594.1 peptidase inhibitor family I36 protein [Parafrankia sp. CH37]CUU55507.1 hypothetical protein Ga0074812_105158 [Parafrankia irregularis]